MSDTEISTQKLLIVKNLNVYGSENKSQIHLHGMWMCLCVSVYFFALDFILKCGRFR